MTSLMSFSMQQVLQILKNMGHDTECGACMEMAFTGVTTNAHTCSKLVTAAVITENPAPIYLPIIRATVVRLKHGCDYVTLATPLPDSVFPFKEELGVRFQAARDTGLDYVEKNFPGIPVELVEG